MSRQQLLRLHFRRRDTRNAASRRNGYRLGPLLRSERKSWLMHLSRGGICRADTKLAAWFDCSPWHSVHPLRHVHGVLPVLGAKPAKAPGRSWFSLPEDTERSDSPHLKYLRQDAGQRGRVWSYRREVQRRHANKS